MFEQMISESLTYATQADVRDLRSLYYGRLDIFVSFSDDSKKVTENNNLPTGIVCHRVEDVVAMKVKVSELYGHVFRIKKARGRFVESVKAYSLSDLQNDVVRLETLPYVYEDDVKAITEQVLRNPLIRSNFERFWEITRVLSDGLPDLWNRVIKDIGYIGFNDPDGIGIFSKRNTPSCLLIDMGRCDNFDIVKVQTREEKRARIRDDVSREVKKMKTARKRVQKKDAKSKKKTVDRLDLSLAYHIARGLQ